MKVTKSGFSLVEMMLAVGALAGVALVVMQLSKNTASTQVDATNTADYMQMRAQVDSMFTNDYDCTASLKGVTFKGSTIKLTPILVEIWHGDQDANRSRKFLSSADPVYKKIGKLTINSISLTMPDYTAPGNFPAGNDEVFKGEIQIIGEKIKLAKTSAFANITKMINITFDTDASGVSTIKYCSSGGSSGMSNLNSPPNMGGAKYCMLANMCPVGWIDNGRAGIIASYGDGAHAKCSALFNPGTDYNGTWGWCHPKICCNQ